MVRSLFQNIFAFLLFFVDCQQYWLQIHAQLITDPI